MTSHVRYTQELLARTAAASTSPEEMLGKLGVTPGPVALSYLHRRMRHYGIDRSHFTSGRGHGPRLLPQAALSPAIAASTSLAALIRLLGLVDNGTSRRLVKRSIEAHGLSIAHFTGQGWRQGTRATTRKSADAILTRLPPGSARTNAALLRRALGESGVPHLCADCGLGDVWQGRRLVLEVDHVNGDRLDNRLENLRYLCPSWHSQTRTFSRGPLPCRTSTQPRG